MLRSKKTLWISLFIAFLVFLSLPIVKFTDPTSTVLFDKNGNLLGALVSDDEQWRFAPLDSVPEKFKSSLLTFEDQHFYQHFGINPFALMRALALNIKYRTIKSGGSTITMQVVRMARKKNKRSYWQKCIEIVLALRLELSKSKEEILIMHASNAPFGGNIVGLEAASWRYFNRSPFDLSWAEAATLAVLPNAPAMIHPGKNRLALLKKRNALLRKLYNKHLIDLSTYQLALLEALPDAPSALPRLAPHLVQRAKKEHLGERIISTIDQALQERCRAIAKEHHNNWKYNHVMNMAILVLDTKTGAVLSYVGNVPGLPSKYAADVDVIQAPRSSGSTLKPLLYAAMLNSGVITPYTLVPDIPSNYGGFTPRNFNLEYDGAVKANQVIVRSLNIPSTFLLKEFGYRPFHDVLKSCGFTTFTRASDDYGLSLILGGGEITLWELCGVYASLGRCLDNPKAKMHAPYYQQNPNIASVTPPFSRAAIQTTFNEISELTRPNQQSGWQYFNSTQQVAWKTGTSFGFRDAWAVGVTPKVTVGVWLGNANGVGQAGLTGVRAAAPVMFDVINTFPNKQAWFKQVSDGTTDLEICDKSGYKAGPYCATTTLHTVPQACQRTAICPYHSIIHLNATETNRVSSECYSVHKMHALTWFTLPPVMEWYYRRKHPEYKPLPTWLGSCAPTNGQNRLALIMPNSINQVYIPKDFGGKSGGMVIELAGARPNQAVYWHLDGAYLTTTRKHHQLVLNPSPGKHSISMVSDQGDRLQKTFTVKSVSN